MTRFIHATRPLRVIFGNGASEEVGEELDRLGIRRALVISTPRGTEAASEQISAMADRVAGIFPDARLHVPDFVAQAAVAEARRVRADGLVALGGGSAIGVAKAVALEIGLPIVALPTTYSGSEMTAVWGMTGVQGKRTGRDEVVAPKVVIYDPVETLGLPPKTTARSGLNAIAHAVEALYAADRSPLSDLLAEEGIRALAESLPGVVLDPGDLPGRAGALRGAHFSGWALDRTTMGLHHKLCHVLGGTFDLPHALVHAILLPHVTAFNEVAVPEAMERAARALNAERASEGLHRLNRQVGISTTLADLGLGSRDLDRASELAVQQSYPNPRPVGREAVRRILEEASIGDP